MFKPRLHFHWRVRSNVHRGISARRGDVKTHLCDREISRGTHQTYEDTEVRTSSRSLRSSSQKEDTQWTCQNWKTLSLDRLINSATVATSSPRKATSVRCEQSSGNTRKLIDGSMETRQRCQNPADIVTRGMFLEGLKESVWLNGPAWLQADEEKWPKPWCQENELDPEQATSTVATENNLEQLFDWRRYSSFNRIRNFIAYCMRFKTKQRGTLKADEIHQAEQILFRVVQNESFPNVSKSIANSKEISKTLNIAKLSPFIEEDGTIRVKDRLKHSNLDYNAKHPIL